MEIQETNQIQLITEIKKKEAAAILERIEELRPMPEW